MWKLDLEASIDKPNARKTRFFSVMATEAACIGLPSFMYSTAILMAI